MSRSHCWVSARPSGSEDVEVSVTDCPVSGVVELAENAAVGAPLAATEMLRETVRLSPSSSLTQSLTVLEPVEVNVRDTLTAVPSS